ncbi:peroxidase 64 [Cucumis melo var. makuwa]|uniref:Peroxidase 64 n=1 Tax=Cucumis melo var. makuwa TaxID=1194695 RepID=A0A5A7UHS7_CUCMM|nr:peroxidase 64 [Cucumis melo var. makuwa]TYJ98268.1 peroxidase 64 [Cucumis melo var. makuwa]
MVQTRIEERLEFIDQEIAGMKKELSKVSAIEISLNEIAKSIDLMRLQSEKQQQLLFTIMETSSRERSAMSGQVTESVAKETEKAKGKENKVTSSKMAESDRNFGFDRNERKMDSDDGFHDRNKFKKIEMPVFTGEDPDSWLFRAERLKVLAEMMEVAQMVENREIVRIEAKLSGYSGGKLTGQINGNGKAVSGNVAGENKGNTSFPIRTITLRSSGPNENRREGSYKRLPDAEFQARKEKGLCFRCNEKYSADHKCKMKEQCELRMFVVTADKEEYEIVEEDKEEKKELSRIEINEDITTVVELSINSVVGLNDLGTMKVRGKLLGEDVIILIDCSATLNFVSEKLVKKLFLPIKETSRYGVILGSGAAVQGKGICEKLEVQLNNWKIIEDFLPLDLGGVDVILGMQWLYSLGVTMVDWKNLSLTFSVDGKSVNIKGDPSLTKARISLKNMIKNWGDKDAGFLIECRSIEVKVVESNAYCLQSTEVLSSGSISSVINQFQDVFEWPEKLPPQREIEHHIHMKEGTNPINVRPYRYGFHKKEEMEKLVKEMLNSRVIRPSTSPYSSPVLLVKKKDGSWRFCVDYRAVNNATIPDKFPIPVVEELFDELCGATMFSKIDLKFGYHQIRMADEDIEKTAFRTHESHYEFLVMPFGLTNAPATFQALMNTIFKPFLRKFVLVFFDDILIYSKNEADHMLHMGKVLSILRQHELYANQKKCHFAQKKLEYLGHVISGEGVAVDPEKIKAISDWPYCCSFNSAIKERGFRWTDEATIAFDKLKSAMLSLPVLAHPNFNQPFEIETDASGFGIGAVLIQDKRPIAYYSHTLALRDRAGPVYERELMAVVLARIIQPQYQKWIAKLLGYSFEVVYKPGAENRAVDALSRKPAEVHLFGLSVPITIDLEVIKKEVFQDPKYVKIVEEIKQLEEPAESKYSLQNGMLMFKNRLSDISMDFVEGLLKSSGFEVILVVVDRLSKYGHFLPLKHPFTAKLVAELFVKEVVRLHGFPLSIVSDRDKIFLSHFWTELFRLSDTKLNRSTAYHPQSDGQTEVVNRGVETYLRCFCNEKPKEWVKWLPWAEYWYNTTFQRAIGMTPFQIVYGRQPPTILSYGSTLSKNSTVEEMLQDRDAVLISLREHLRLAQEQMKVYADRKRR